MVASSWRPDRSREERLARSVQSMIPGTGGGRITVARPLKGAPLGNSVGDVEEDDEDDNGFSVGGTLRPWTDRFVIEKAPGGGVELALSWDPWAHHKCASLKAGISLNDQLEEMGILPWQVTIHLYWNGVFQPDSRYSVSGAYISIADPNRRIRVGDEFIVKYFFKTDGKQQAGVPTWRLQTRHTGSSGTAEVAGAPVPQMNLFGGQLSGFDEGTMYSTVWDNQQFSPSQTWAFRKEPGTPNMPTGRPLIWEIGSIDTDARVAVSGVVAQGGQAPQGLGMGFYERCTVWPFGFRGRGRNRLVGNVHPTDGLPTDGPWVTNDGGGIRIPFTDSQAMAAQGAMNAGAALGITVTVPTATGVTRQQCCGVDTGSWPGPCPGGGDEGGDFYVSGLHAEGLSGTNAAQMGDFSIRAYDPDPDSFDWPEEEEDAC